MNLLYTIRRARDLHGARPAILSDGGTLTWNEFYQSVERSAAFLETSGLKLGDRVAVLLSNSPAFLELYYSTALSGVIIVPLNIRWALQDFTFSILDSGAKALVVDHRFYELGVRIQREVPALTLIYAGRGACPGGALNYRAGVAAAVPHQWPEPAPDDVAGIFYTSGTTGGPKGAMLTHRNVYSNAVLAYASGLSTGAVYLHASPMFHLADGAMTHIATMTGAAHCFVEVFDVAAVLQSIEQHRVTSTIIAPTMVNMIVNHPDVPRYDLTSLEKIVYGASPMPVPLLLKAMELLRCKFQQGYGMTETSPVISLLQPEDHRLENLDARFAPIRSIGKPILGMEVRVVDWEDQPVPAGQAGEIIARGDNVMKGYWNRPEITAEVLRGGWMHTGDIGTFDDEGFLYILDRKKDMIKTGGENVCSPEVESMIVSHQDVLEAAVIGVPHELWGEAVCAVVVLRPGASCTEAELIEYCRAHMTHFKCPSRIEFTDALPKGGTGKVQKQALRRTFGGSPAAASAS